MLRVKPEAGEWLGRHSFALRDLVFVMRKNVVDSSAMNVESLAKILHRHGRALQMPARATGAKGRFPFFLGLFFWAFPQHEVVRLLLFVFIGIDAGTDLQLSTIQPR